MQLTELNVADTEVSNQCLAQLAPLSNLATLNCSTHVRLCALSRVELR